MSKQFIEGNVYVFTKKKFIDSQRKNEMKVTENTLAWVNEINGMVIAREGEREGCIKGYGIIPKWCKCIKNNN